MKTLSILVAPLLIAFAATVAVPVHATTPAGTLTLAQYDTGAAPNAAAGAPATTARAQTTQTAPDAKAPPAQEKKATASPDMTIRAPGLIDQANEAAVRRQIQPGNNAPVWREVRSGAGAYASVPGREMNVLVQSEGQEWRARRNGFWAVIAGWLLVAVVAVLAIFYVVKGTVQLEHPETGRKILRFTQLERWVHWFVAVTWTILAITGLIMLFGKNILLPVIGYTLFSALASLSKNMHNLIGPLFFVSVLVMVITYARYNWPRGYDIKWLLKLGGLFSKEHPPSGKFNGGEKMWFWGGVLVIGTVVSISGLVLNFPNFDQTRATMQTANIVHLISTGMFMALGLGHIYLGTIGLAGTYRGMKTGLVDEEWAREHHRYWYEDVKSGKIDAYVGEARPVRVDDVVPGPAD